MTTDDQQPDQTDAEVHAPDAFEPARTFADGPAEVVDADDLATFGEWPASVVDEIRAAERAAQASVCHVPDGDLPDELAEALDRRVEVNLAQYDGANIVRVGSKDPEVRRLEAPFSRRRAAGSIDHRTQEGQS